MKESVKTNALNQAYTPEDKERNIAEKPVSDNIAESEESRQLKSKEGRNDELKKGNR